jgi:hypothetical protein
MKWFAAFNALVLAAASVAGAVIYVTAGRYFARNVIFIAPLLNESRLHFTVGDIERLRLVFPDYTIVAEMRGSVSFEPSAMHEPVTAVYTESAYFELTHTDFLFGGHWHTREDLDCVVINESLAWNLFGNTDAVGITVEINGMPYTINGVIRQGNAMNTVNMAWLPHPAAEGRLPVTALYIQPHRYNEVDAAADVHEMLVNRLYKNPADYAAADINRYIESIGIRNRVLLYAVWLCVIIIFAALTVKRYAKRKWLYAGLYAALCLVVCYFFISGVYEVLNRLPDISVINHNALPPEGYLSFGMRQLSRLNRYASYVWLAGAAALLNLIAGGRAWVK